jgi:hypothetical protein
MVFLVAWHARNLSRGDRKRAAAVAVGGAGAGVQRRARASWLSTVATLAAHARWGRTRAGGGDSTDAAPMPVTG